MNLELALEFQTLVELDLNLELEYSLARDFDRGLLLSYNTSDQFDLGLALEMSPVAPFDLDLAVYLSTTRDVESAGGGGGGGGGRPAAKPWTLLVMNGTEVPLANWSCSEEINGAWHWQCEIPAKLAIDFDEGTPFAVYGEDGLGNPLNAPPLVANTTRSRTKDINTGWTTRLTGTDRTSYALTLPGQSWPTFLRTSAAAIVGMIAGRAGVTVHNRPAFPIWDEDVKQSDLWAALLRYAEVEGANVLIDPSGDLRYVPNVWTGTTAEFWAESITDGRDPSKEVTQMKFAKRLAAMEGEQNYKFDSLGYRIVQLKNPLLGAVAVNVGQNPCVLVGFWEGEPGTGGRMVGFQDFGFNPNAQVTVAIGVGKATHMSLSVAELPAPLNLAPVAAELVVYGTPPEQVPAGIDLAFEVTIGTSKRPATGVRTEPLYPSKAWVQSRAERYLWEVNKHAFPLEAKGPLQYTASLGQVVRFFEFAPARIERIEHSHTPESVGTTLKGVQCPWLT